MKKKTQKSINNIKTIYENNKKPIIIGAIAAGAAALAVGLGKAFASMKKSAKAQHEVDKTEFAAAEMRSEEANVGYEDVNN